VSLRQSFERDAAADVARSRRRRILLQGNERRRQRRLRQHVVVVTQNDVRPSPCPRRVPVLPGEWRHTYMPIQHKFDLLEIVDAMLVRWFSAAAIFAASTFCSVL
jgi:hypothetical protein